LVIALDTFSVGFPAVVAAKILGKKTIVRVGGDFLWEAYIERTGNRMTLKEFYEKKPILSAKEKMIYTATKFVVKKCSSLVFSTDWQKDIWRKAYGINSDRSLIIENFYGEKTPGSEPKEKNFIWAGRPLILKNVDMLESAFNEAVKGNKDIKLEIYKNLPYQILQDKLRTCYAVILPSISEVSPNFILDALAFGKPFICTKETGFYEKLNDIGIFYRSVRQG